MKISILTDYGGMAGMGHFSRCNAIRDAFLDIGVTPIIYLYTSQDTILPAISNIVKFNWHKDKIKTDKLIRSSDIVIVDSLLAPPKVLVHISHIAKYPVFIDDYRKIKYIKGVIIDWTISQDVDKENIYNDKHQLLCGVKYTCLRKEFWKIKHPRIKINIKKVMISFGGSDPRNLTLPFLNTLKENFPGLHYEYISTKSPLTAAQMIQLMLRSDLAIVGGGQTMYELSRIGIPTIAVITDRNNYGDVTGWEKAGTAINIGWWNDKKLSINLISSVQRLHNYDIRLKMSKTGKSLIDGKGAGRIAKYLINSYEHPKY